jgi:hypothetical protein
MRKHLLFLLGTVCLSFTYLQAQNWVNGGNSLSANGYLGTNTNYSLIFETNGVERGRITNGGNWNIGTTVAPSKLGVNAASGASPFRAQIAGVNKLIVNSNGSTSIGSSTAGPTNGLYVAGNVGIGTATPAHKLHVVGGGISIHGNSSTGTGVMGTGATFGLHGTGTGTNSYGVYGTGNTYGVYGTSNNYGVYGTGSSSGVYGSGSFGVSGTGSSRGVYGSGPIGVYGSGGAYGVYGTGNTYGLYGTGTGTNSFGVHGKGSSYGIYGTAPSSTSNTYGVYGTAYYGVYGLGSGYGVYGKSTYAAVYGLGGTLGVVGTGNSYGVYGSSSSYAGYFQGKVYAAGGYTSGSDRKLKQNITELSSAIDIINKLQPKAYEFRQDGDYQLMNLPKGKHFGLIAQDLEEVLPDLVHEVQFNKAIVRPGEVNLKATEANSGTLPLVETEQSKGEVIDYKAVNYMELIPILVKGMQEQQQVIDKLEQHNDEQQQQIDNLKTMVSKLSSGQGFNTFLSSAQLGEAIPNPVKGTASIQYAIPEGSNRAHLLITDALGRQIKALQLSASGVIHIDVSTLASGMYNYSLIVDNKSVVTRKMTVVK